MFSFTLWNAFRPQFSILLLFSQKDHQAVDILLAEIDVYELFAFKHCKGRKVKLALCEGAFFSIADLWVLDSVISNRNPHGCHIIFLSNCFDYSFCAFSSLFSLFVSKNLMRGCEIWKPSFSHLKEMHMMRFIREKPWRHSNEWRAGICLAMNMRYFHPMPGFLSSAASPYWFRFL